MQAGDMIPGLFFCLYALLAYMPPVIVCSLCNAPAAFPIALASVSTSFVWPLHGCMSGFCFARIPILPARKRLQPHLAFVPCILLPLLVFRLHILKSWFCISRNESSERPHKRYTSPQRPFMLSWYTDTTHSQKRDTGHLWGCHGIPAH